MAQVANKLNSAQNSEVQQQTPILAIQRNWGFHPRVRSTGKELKVDPNQL